MKMIIVAALLVAIVSAVAASLARPVHEAQLRLAQQIAARAQ
jgi:hypothetical protein